MATVRNLPTTDIAPQPQPQPPPTLALAPSTADALVPRSMADAIKLAELMAGADVLPAHFRSKPGNCLAVIEQAMRWDMSPFAVAQKTFFVQGRMGYEAQLIAAVVHARAPLDGRLKITWEGDGKTRVCRVTGRFNGDPEPKVKSSPQVGAITVKNSPLWAVDPDQQLAYWTIRAWARLYAPEVILGVYDRDEVAEMHIGSENAVDVTPPPAAPRPASRLDALAASITTHDPDTGASDGASAGLSSPGQSGTASDAPGQPATTIDNGGGADDGPPSYHPPAGETEPASAGASPAAPGRAIPTTKADWQKWLAAAKGQLLDCRTAVELEDVMRSWTISGHTTELRHFSEGTAEKFQDLYDTTLDGLRDRGGLV